MTIWLEDEPQKIKQSPSLYTCKRVNIKERKFGVLKILGLGDHIVLRLNCVFQHFSVLSMDLLISSSVCIRSRVKGLDLFFKQQEKWTIDYF